MQLSGPLFPAFSPLKGRRRRNGEPVRLHQTVIGVGRRENLLPLPFGKRERAGERVSNCVLTAKGVLEAKNPALPNGQISVISS
jgi:hypothetical protein